jgi:hypothetical protein
VLIAGFPVGLAESVAAKPGNCCLGVVGDAIFRQVLV